MKYVKLCTLKCGHEKRVNTRELGDPVPIGATVTCPTCGTGQKIIGVEGPEALARLLKF